MKPLATVALLALLAGCAGHEDAVPVETDRVEIPGPWVFEPAAIVVKAGATVTFTNRGAAHHSVTADALGLDADLAPGASTTHVFATPGEHEYVCKYHPPDMKGRIIVQEA